MSEINHEETMSPALLGCETQALSSKIRRRVEDLRRFDAPSGRVSCVADHTLLLCRYTIDVVNIAERWVP